MRMEAAAMADGRGGSLRHQICSEVSSRDLSMLMDRHGTAYSGKEVGPCITHLCESFIFFSLGMMEFIVLKDESLARKRPLEFCKRKLEQVDL
ncbi:hypothetical protein U1Q18_008490 [Sarracenia purpurea var. burkii]